MNSYKNTLQHLGIGLDLVDSNRFQSFSLKNKKQLQRIFSPAEIQYCLLLPRLSAQRFAALFAAKEALFKALSQAYEKPPCPLLTLFRASEVIKETYPRFVIDWEMIASEPAAVFVTLTHTHYTTAACVVVQKI